MSGRVSLLLALLCALPLSAEETQRYLVATRSKPTASRLRALADDGAHHLRTFANVNAFGTDLTAAEVSELRRSSDVEFVTPVVERVALELDPSAQTGVSVPHAGVSVPHAVDFELSSSWGVEAVRAPEVWPVTRGEGINVAVLDTGIDITHPDLRDAYAGGYNTLVPSQPPQDDNKHGTHVAGIIAAGGNGFGVIGVAPGAKLWAVKVLNSEGTGTDESVVAGIDWVIERAKAGGLWIINLSLGSNSPSDVEQRAVERAFSEGIVVVASAGNRTTWIRYPARYPGVIAVGAVDSEGNRADFSSYGRGISIMAPGVAILSSMPQGTVRTADVRSPDAIVEGWGLIGSPLGTVHGALMSAGFGRPEDFPVDIAGHVALIERGLIPFREKARNAKNAGASAVVIWNSEVAEGTEQWTLIPAVSDPEWENYVFPLVVGVQRDEGLRLQAVTDAVDVGFRDDSYGKLNGTSMSCPHVVGIVALMRALAPQTPVPQIKYVLEHTAHDMEAEGFDLNTGWGTVDALAAAQYVAPEKFGVAPPVPQPSRRRRAVP